MPLTGDYAPSTAAWARELAERNEASAGREAGELRGKPIIVLTSVGARTGHLRKTALMRVEHEGRYAVVVRFSPTIDGAETGWRRGADARAEPSGMVVRQPLTGS